MGPGDLGIGHRLRQERLLAGKTREELAKTLGIDGPLLQSYETGDRQIPARHLAAAITALGVPLTLFSYDIAGIGHLGMERGPWHAVPRPPKVLSWPSFSQAHPVLKLWEANRGKMNDELQNALVAGRLNTPDRSRPTTGAIVASVLRTLRRRDHHHAALYGTFVGGSRDGCSA